MDAVIFDLDGTLVDSEGVHARALDDVVVKRGMRGRAEGYVGLTDRQALELIFADHGFETDPAHIRSIIDEKTDLVVEYVRRDGVKAYPGAIDFVRLVAQHVPVAVCTASASGEALLALELAGLSDSVSTVITCCDVTENKPHPMGYLAAVERLGVEAERAVAIEDSRNGLTAARNAGLFAVGVRHTCPDDHLELAHKVVDTIDLLTVEMLREWWGAGRAGIASHSMKR